MKDFFKPVTLKIHRPFGRVALLAIVFIPAILLVFEVFLRFIPIPARLFVPTIDRDLNYPEIDIKLSHLTAMERAREVNCYIMGSSMADFGLNPMAFNEKKEILGVKEPVCFNMALKAMKPEAQAKIAAILLEDSNPRLMIVGISPVDFTGGQEVVRKFARAPWVLYREGSFSSEGWWVENSFLYRYWLSFLKYRDPAYRKELKSDLGSITLYGAQIKPVDPVIYRVKPVVAFPVFFIKPADLDGLVQMVRMKSERLNVIVVEMPVHPESIHYYIPGGEAGYEQLFIKPISAVLEQEGVSLIRTQEQSANVISPDGWKDYLHLNEKGNRQFSQWLAARLSESPPVSQD